MFSITKKTLLTSITVLCLLSFLFYRVTNENDREQFNSNFIDPIQQNSSSQFVETSEEYKVAHTGAISCFSKTEGDALPSIKDLSPSDEPIFFLENSCSELLNSRQACSIESAARAHPKKNIFVLFTGPISENILSLTHSSIYELKKYSNIKFARVHINEYVKGTPVEKLFENNELKTIDTTEVLKILTLYKFGGLYLDLDIIVMKPMDPLGRNWVAKESDTEVSSAALNVARDDLGRGFMKKVLEAINKSIPGELYKGHGVLQRELLKFCNTTKVEQLSETICYGFQVYESDEIYPKFDSYQQLFRRGELINTDDAYLVHLLGSQCKDLEVQIGSTVEQLADMHCPVIYELYGDSFGF